MGNGSYDGALFACRPPDVVARAGKALVEIYCSTYRDEQGAIVALGKDAALNIQRYLMTQGLLQKTGDRYTVDWSTAKRRLDGVSERWKGTTQVILIDGARAAAFIDRADNGEMTPGSPTYRN